MDWTNSEHYQDYTAAEAMLRVMEPDPEDADALDDEGCRLLIDAIVRKAAEDLVRALRRRTGRSAAAVRQAEAFFRSDGFRRLTGMNGEALIRMIRKELEKE